MNYYYPKRPVKSFQDLEVYQKTLAIGVAVTKRLNNPKISAVVLSCRSTATAHSWRFAHQAQAIEILEEAMLNCNLAVVYLEQYRDLENPSTDGVEIEFLKNTSKVYCCAG
jgi:hypothetical protein